MYHTTTQESCNHQNPVEKYINRKESKTLRKLIYTLMTAGQGHGNLPGTNFIRAGPAYICDSGFLLLLKLVVTRNKQTQMFFHHALLCFFVVLIPNVFDFFSAVQCI
jgi:hypothetical protein